MARILSQVTFTEIVFLTTLSTFCPSAATTQTKPALCQPYKVPVEVDPPNHMFIPYYVEMHRCQGQCDNDLSPTNCECVPVPNTQQDVKVDLIGGPKGTEIRTISNHTRCKSQCKPSYKSQCLKNRHQWDESSCSCSCPKPPSGTTCKANQVWSDQKCECVCNTAPTSCASKMAWNKSLCGCTCSIEAFSRCSEQKKATNPINCQCIATTQIGGQVGDQETKGSETKLVAALVVIGLLLGTLFVIDLVLMCKKKGFMYGLASNCREDRDNPELTNQDTDSGSVHIENDNSSADCKLNGHCKHKKFSRTQDSATCV